MNTNQDGQQSVIVLLAEDDALVRMMAADVLREEGGFKVVEVVNADEALTVLEAPADVRALVTDVEMPGSLDGFTLARVVKQAWAHIGIVVTSGRMAPGPKRFPQAHCSFPSLTGRQIWLLPCGRCSRQSRPRCLLKLRSQCFPQPSRSVSPTPASGLLAGWHSPFLSPKDRPQTNSAFRRTGTAEPWQT